MNEHTNSSGGQPARSSGRVASPGSLASSRRTGSGAPRTGRLTDLVTHSVLGYFDAPALVAQVEATNAGLVEPDDYQPKLGWRACWPSCLEALLAAPLSPDQLDGAAELFTCREWTRPMRAEVPEPLRSLLVAHVSATGTDPMQVRMRHGYGAGTTAPDG